MMVFVIRCNAVYQHPMDFKYMDSIYLQIYYTGFKGDLKVLWNQINSKVAQFLHFLSSLYFPLSQSMYSF